MFANYQYTIKPGTVIATVKGGFWHVGVYSNIGTVISNSRCSGGVIEESLNAFCNGKQIKILGYPSQLPPFEVIYRARQLIGKKYNVFNYNCEHFVREVHGLKPESPQLNQASLLAACIGLCIYFLD